MNLYKKLPAVFPVLAFLLIFSFCVLLSCAFSLSAEADAALSHAKSLSPLSLPDAVLTPCVCPDEETLSDLSYLGKGMIGARAEISLDGMAIQVIGLPGELFADAFTLSPGFSLPARTGCSAVSADPAPLPPVGTRIPVSEDLFPGGYLTVTSHAKNAYSLLVKENGSCFLYTDLSAWAPEAREENAVIFFLYNDNISGDYLYSGALNAAKSLGLREYERRNTEKAEKTGGISAQIAKILAEILDHTDRIDSLKTELTHLEERIPALENGLLILDAALEKAVWEFNAEMERLEHFSVGQTTMIPQKEEAEKGFAVQRAEIEKKRAELSALYTARSDAEAEIVLHTKETERLFAEKTALDVEYNQAEVSVSSVEMLSEPFRIEYGVSDEALSGKKQTLRPMYVVSAALVFISCALTFFFCFLYHIYRRRRPVYLCFWLLSVVSGILAGCILSSVLFPEFFSHLLSAASPYTPSAAFTPQHLLPLFFAVFPLLSAFAGKKIRNRILSEREEKERMKKPS